MIDTVGTPTWAVHHWDHWYDYTGSYWTKPRPGVDAGEPSRLAYAVQILVGHHGLFSLTPIWLLVPWGLRLRSHRRQNPYRQRLSYAIAAVTVICLLFFVSRPMVDRNYGGVSCCFRWMLWMAPLWIWCIIPPVMHLREIKWGRPLLLILLMASVFSVATVLDNPWQHPWLYQLGH